MMTLNRHGNTLLATLSGTFDFNVSRELIHACKSHLNKTGITHIEVRLEQVTDCNSCAIGAMLLLSEWVHGNFRLDLKDCHADVHGLFDSGLLGRYFSGTCPATGQATLARSCANCLDGNCRENAARPRPGCPLMPLIDPLLPKLRPT